MLEMLIKRAYEKLDSNVKIEHILISGNCPECIKCVVYRDIINFSKSKHPITLQEFEEELKSATDIGMREWYSDFDEYY